MSLYKKAVETVDSFLKEHNLESHWGALNNDLHYYLGYKETPITDEEKVPLGVSKVRGLPHLPDSFEFLPGELFIAQLNLSDIKPYNFNNVLPNKGILYLFLDESTSLSRCSYYDGPPEKLKVRPYPKQDNKLYDKKMFLKESYTIDFTDGEIINMGKNLFAKILGEHFKGLTALLKEQFGSAVVINDYGYIDDTPNNFVFGKPRFYNDEYFFEEEEEDEEYEDEEYEDEGYDDEDGNEGGYPSCGECEHLLFCMEYGEGHVNFFSKAGIHALDVTKDMDKQIVAIYSGT